MTTQPDETIGTGGPDKQPEPELPQDWRNGDIIVLDAGLGVRRDDVWALRVANETSTRVETRACEDSDVPKLAGVRYIGNAQEIHVGIPELVREAERQRLISELRKVTDESADLGITLNAISMQAQLLGMNR